MKISDSDDDYSPVIPDKPILYKGIFGLKASESLKLNSEMKTTNMKKH